MWTRKVRRKDDTRELGSNHRLSSVRQKTKDAVDGFKCTLHLSPPLPLHPLLFLHHSRLARARHMLSVQEFHFSARCRGLPAQLLKTRRVFGGSVGDIKVRPAWPWSNLLREGTKERRCRSRERAGAGGEAAEWRGRVAHPGENDRRRDRQPRGETGSPTDRIAQVALQRKKRRGHDALDVPEAFRLLWNG